MKRFNKVDLFIELGLRGSYRYSQWKLQKDIRRKKEQKEHMILDDVPKRIAQGLET